MDVVIPWRDLSASGNGRSVPAFVVSEFLAPCCPALHLLSVSVASLFAGPSALGGLTHDFFLWVPPTARLPSDLPSPQAARDSSPDPVGPPL